MKYLSMLLLLMPALLCSQQQTTRKDTTKVVQRAVTIPVTFTNDGKLKFPDNTVQETAYPGTSAQGATQSTDYKILNNGIEFPDGTVQTTAYNPSSNPPQVSPGLYLIIEGFNNSSNPIPINAAADNISMEVSMVTGDLSNRARELPQWSKVFIERAFDTRFPNLINEIVTTRIIPYVEIIYNIAFGSSVKTVYSARYCNVLFSDFEFSNDGDSPAQVFSIAFTRVSYCSAEFDQSGNQVSSTKISSYNLETGIFGEGSCNCNL